jgi:hypothetical protein
MTLYFKIGYEDFVRVLFRLSRYIFRRYRFRDEEMVQNLHSVKLILVK